ncbi:hypothetical protein [Sporosarcina sp. P17b]|uniref:hypothetical protein n=1 Tax=Sporosarcina sp. P17b TaxID=2048260 RepID=UPI000C16845B|nr:hypothetical protein [Sporosarcina sp. P17b]PIC72403.1 hypothetical protein CSV76_15260 [Sporosarcina sp. P17b]
MAEYKVTYTAEGKVKHELTYKGLTFDYTMVPHSLGKTSDKKSFDSQMFERMPYEDSEVLEAVGDLDFADEDVIEEVISFLSERE